MKWPWVSKKAAEARVQAAIAAADQVRVADEASFREAIRIRDVQIRELKADSMALNSIEAVAGLYCAKIAGETWREYSRRILHAFKDGADTVLFKAILDEVGRHERQAWVDATACKDPSDLLRTMGGVDMARTIKARLQVLTGRSDQLTERDRERQLRAQSVFSDTEDQILGQEVLDGRIPKR